MGMSMGLRDYYARWFVREHFLRKDYEVWKDAGDTNSGGVYQYRQILAHQGMNCSGTYAWTAKLSGYTWPGHQNYFVNLSELQSDDPPSSDLPHTPSARVSATDLVLECRRRFRKYEQLYQDDCTWQWLISEAEYRRIYNEALLRADGVDVKTP